MTIFPHCIATEFSLGGCWRGTLDTLAGRRRRRASRPQQPPAAQASEPQPPENVGGIIKGLPGSSTSEDSSSNRNRNDDNSIRNDATNGDGAPLSKRARLNLDTVMAKVPPKMLETSRPTASSDIDLSLAENWLIRKEVLRQYQTAFSEKFGPSVRRQNFVEEALVLTGQLLSWPDGFWGDHDLLRSLAGFFNRRFRPFRPVRYEHITTAPGAAGCLDALIYSICDAGDGVLVPTPYWNGYNVFFAARCAVSPVPVTVENVEASLTSAALIPALERALAIARRPIKALVIANPHNPLGRCYSRNVLEDLLRFCSRHNLHLVSDEVFALSTFKSPELPPTPFTSVLSLDAAGLGCNASLVHAVWSTSKDLGSSGVKMANKPLRDAISVAVPMKLPTVTSLLTSELLNSPDFPKMIETNSVRLGEAYNRLTSFLKKKGITYLPCDAGTFVLARIAPWAETWEDEAAVISRLAECGVIISSGRQYRMHEPGWARICFAAEKKVLKEALGRMDRARVLQREKPQSLSR